MALPATASLPQSGSIISRWKLDEASGNRSDSVGSNTLTDNNTVLSATGSFSDTAADFESTNSESLSIADASQSGLDITGSFSFSAWMKFESLPSGSEMSFFSKWGSVAADESYILAYQDVAGTKSFRYVLENSSSALTIGTKTFTVTTGTWYHICITVTTATPSATLYINGISQGAFTNSSSSATTIRNGGGAFHLGSRASAINYYDGLMQDAVVWSVVLSASEVKSLMSSYFNLPALTSLPQNGSIVSRWPLWEDGETRYDFVGSNTLTDNATVLAGTGLSVSGASAQRSADFESTNTEYLSITDASQSGLDITGNMSFAYWIYFESLPAANNAYNLFTKWNGGVSQAYRHTLNCNGSSVISLRLQTSSNGTNTNTADQTWTPSTATWYHVTGVYSTAGSVTFYVNGTALGSAVTGLHTSLFNSSAAFYLGNVVGSTETHDGLMQDVMVWSGVSLSDSEVTTLYNAYIASAGQFMTLNRGFW